MLSFQNLTEIVFVRFMSALFICNLSTSVTEITELIGRMMSRFCIDIDLLSLLKEHIDTCFYPPIQ